MLLFACQPADSSKLYAENGRIVLWQTLEAAQAFCGGRVFVVNPEVLEEEPEPLASESTDPGSAGGGRLSTGRLPLEALRNVQPYRPPAPVTAGGGYVLRANATDLGGEPEVLLIHRKGRWDLPKGKQDEGETVKQCARREVQEEVGASSMLVLRGLGTTVHGYPDGDVYAVKTTHWFWMQTNQQEFTPQQEEQIDEVAWVPWSEARERLGYETLRRHMDQAAEIVLGR